MIMILSKTHFKDYYLKARSTAIQDEKGGPNTGRKGPNRPEMVWIVICSSRGQGEGCLLCTVGYLVAALASSLQTVAAILQLWQPELQTLPTVSLEGWGL